MREAAEHIATLELGPATQMDVAKKLAKSVKHERFTSLDRDLLSKAENQIIDLSKIPLDGSDWSQRFEKWRVKHLSSMGLAEKVGFGKWRLDDRLEPTLRRMGDRGDILKAYHRAMSTAKLERSQNHEPIYDSLASGAQPITGRVLEMGILDDVNDRSFLVIDTMHGEALFVETGKAANISEIERGMIVTAGPQSFEPKPSDYTIADIASKRGGVYSPSAHEMSDPKAREEFIQAHVRRLEGMRRAGHATRNSDGSWELPKDYIRRARAFETARGFANPVKLDVRSHSPLSELPKVIGKTWLDTENLSGGSLSGFGKEVEAAKAQRQNFLLAKNIIQKSSGVTPAALNTLENMDLDAAGRTIAQKMGKPYAATTGSGRISGVYREAIQRPSGKYAIIEKSKEFTLVPWRKTMDRNLGKSISGVMKGQTISWTLTKGRGIPGQA